MNSEVTSLDDSTACSTDDESVTTKNRMVDMHRLDFDASDLYLAICPERFEGKPFNAEFEVRPPHFALGFQNGPGGISAIDRDVSVDE